MADRPFEMETCMLSGDRKIPAVANHGTMKNRNISTFMQALVQNAPVSRADLSRLTGLDKKCISMFSSELMEAGFIHEAGMETISRGRPGWLLDFIPGRNYSIGLAVQADRINCAVFEFPRQLVKTAVYPLSASMSRQDLIETVRRAALDMSKKVKNIAGIGIGFPGMVDLGKGIIHTAANLSCLNKFSFREPFKKLGLAPLRFEQSSRAAALAESWFGRGATAGNFANIEINVGISVVMVNRSGLYHGPESFVGELGHVVVQPRGKKCRCGNQGCLEAYLGETALKAEMQAVGVDPERLFPRDHSSTPSVDDLCTGERRVLTKAGSWLGRGLGAIVNLFNPNSIIIQGDLMRYADIVLPSARKELAKSSLTEKLMHTSILPSSLAMPDAMGTAALAFPGWFEGGFDESRFLDSSRS